MRKHDFMNWSVESALRIGLLFLIVMISYLIFKPFLILVVWGVIIAIAFYPLYKKLVKVFKGNDKLASAVLVLSLLAIFLAPTISFVNTLIDSSSQLAATLKDGSFNIPPPNEEIAEWPIVGKPISDFWHMAYSNLRGLLESFRDELSNVGVWFISSIGGLMGTVFVFFFAVIISGVFLTKADDSYSFAISLAEKLVGEKGKQMVDNSKATIQSVVKGVIGVAFIQTFLIGLGLLAVDVPAASIIILIAFIMALAQLPAILIVLPVVIYVFSVESTTVAVIFAIYEVIASLSDNFLKPILLGRGVEIPMLVILIGSIGGMILMGMVGLFVGPVVFALAYQLFTNWISLSKSENSIN